MHPGLSQSRFPKLFLQRKLGWTRADARASTSHSLTRNEAVTINTERKEIGFAPDPFLLSLVHTHVFLSYEPFIVQGP